MIINVTHKYPWKLEQIFTISFFALVPFILYGFTFTGTVNMISVYIFGTISAGLAIWLFTLNYKRLKKSILHATVNEEGILTIWGAGLEADKNKGNPEELKTISFDEKSFHPTLIFTYEDGKTVRVPRRIALVPELNEYLRFHMPKTLTVTNPARETFEAIFLPPEARKYKAPITEKLESSSGKPQTIDEINNGKKPVNLEKLDAKKRKLEKQEEKRAKEERLAASIAAMNAEENKIGKTTPPNRLNYNSLNAPDYNEPEVVIEPSNEATDGEFAVDKKVERNTFS